MSGSAKKSVDDNSLDQIVRSLKKMLMKQAFAESSINTTTKLTIRSTGEDPSKTYTMISDSTNTTDSQAGNSQKFKEREKYVTVSCPECGTKITMTVPNKNINIGALENSAIINNSETNSFVAEKPLTCCSSGESSHTESPRTPNTVNKKSSLLKSSRTQLRLTNSSRGSIMKKSTVKNTLSPSYKSTSTSTPRNSIAYSRPLTPRISEIHADETSQYNASTTNSSSAFKSPLSGIYSFSKTYSIEKLQTPSPVRRGEQKLDNDRVSRTQFSKIDKCRRRSNSTKNIPAIKKPITNRRSQSANVGNVRSTKMNEPNSLVNKFGKAKLPISSLAKKQETKIPVPKKASKIVQVQQGKFSKTDNSAGAKKQESAATGQLPTNSMAVPMKRSRFSAITAVPTEAVDGVYNRYGYRLRKYEAMAMMSRKLRTHTSDKRTENRILNQHIRVDRRFNASMERRNKG